MVLQAQLDSAANFRRWLRLHPSQHETTTPPLSAETNRDNLVIDKNCNATQPPDLNSAQAQQQGRTLFSPLICCKIIE